MAESKLNQMKSESLEEARERLAEQSRLEREGFDAVSEGQLVADRVSIDGDPEEDSPRARVLAVNDALRVLPSVQDQSDEQSVEWTRSTMDNGPDVQVHGEDAPKRSSRRSAPKRSSRKSGGE